MKINGNDGAEVVVLWSRKDIGIRFAWESGVCLLREDGYSLNSNGTG